MLNTLEFRAGNAPKIVFVHGFGQRAEVWTDIAELVQSDVQVVAVDLPGHGESSEKFDSADLAQAAELVMQAGGHAIYVGYSLGARVLLSAIDNHASAPLGYVLVGGKLGLRDEAREFRRNADRALAENIERDGLEPFMDDWLRQPFIARLSAKMQYRDLRLTNRGEGLAASLRNCGLAEQQTTLDSVRHNRVPVALVRGDDDLVQVQSDQAKLADAIPNSSLHVIEKCGHSVPFEQPAAFAAAVDELVARVQAAKAK